MGIISRQQRTGPETARSSADVTVLPRSVRASVRPPPVPSLPKPGRRIWVAGQPATSPYAEPASRVRAAAPDPDGESAAGCRYIEPNGSRWASWQRRLAPVRVLSGESIRSIQVFFREVG